MLELGAAAPDASLLQQDMTPVTPGELAADGPILLSFYLYDWTDTCRSQLRNLRDRHDEFEALGIRVFGVSRDSPYSHVAYAQQQWLNFPLLTDWSGAAVSRFGQPGLRRPHRQPHPQLLPHRRRRHSARRVVLRR